MPEATRIPLTSESPNAERVAMLQSLFPEAFDEGRLDFGKLKAALGEAAPIERERYGLSWAGKSEAVHGLQALSVGTLQPVRGESVRFDETGNAIIEGDNLEVLKLLQKSYNGKIKMIYIDPPYNTGNEFIYPDNFREGLQDYLRYSGQLDGDGFATNSNSERDGRYHSKWLSMMYPRLFLAKNLLREDGVIFVSIDDNEVASLRLLMDEIFGEENYLSSFVRRRRLATGMRDTPVSPDHEYIVSFTKYINTAALYGFQRLESDFPFIDELGKYRSTDLTVGMTRKMRPNQFYAIKHPRIGTSYFPPTERVWRFEPSTMQRQIEGNNIIWPDDSVNGKMTRPRFKTRLNGQENEDKANPISTWIDNKKASNQDTDATTTMTAGLNQEATKELRDLLGEQTLEYPKPVSLIKGLIAISSRKEDIILDFFAGSGTTAQAVLELNKEDGGDRKFILVQLPEKTASKQYPSIADITRERVRRVIARMDEADAGKLALDGEASRPDRGFKAFRLASSNFKIWDGGAAGQDQEEVSRQLALFADNVLPDASPEGILFEILIKGGYELSVPREEILLAGHPVTSVSGGSLLVCLERPVTRALLDGMIALAPKQVVCLNKAFHGDDSLLTNIVLQMKDAGVEFRTI